MDDHKVIDNILAQQNNALIMSQRSARSNDRSNNQQEDDDNQLITRKLSKKCEEEGCTWTIDLTSSYRHNKKDRCMICEAGRLADVNGTDNAILREESAAQFAQYSFQGSKNVAVRRDNDTEQIRGLSEIYGVGAWANVAENNRSQLLNPIDE